jgi:hypothetical protein
MRRLLVALVLLAGCKHHSSQHDFVQPHYADGTAGLHAMWSDILGAAREDDRERVHDLLATTLLSDADMRRLFGAKADPLLPRYHQLMGTLINRGAIELVANVYEHKYDTVDAFANDDPTLATAMVEPHPLFAARVRKGAEVKGLKYEGFFFLDGKWKSLNQLGKFIDVVPAAPVPAGATK